MADAPCGERVAGGPPCQPGCLPDGGQGRPPGAAQVVHGAGPGLYGAGSIWIRRHCLTASNSFLWTHNVSPGNPDSLVAGGTSRDLRQCADSPAPSGRRHLVRDTEVTGDARQALGAELAAYRHAAGHSQARLARLTGYSRSTVANVETGRQRVPRDFWEGADTALQTGGVLAAGSDEISTAARGGLRAAARSVSAARQARTWQPDLGSSPGAAPDGADSCTEHARSAPVSFCAPGPEPPAAPGAESSPASASAPARWPQPAGGSPAGHTGRPRQASPGDVARLRSMRQHLKAIDNAHGGGAVLPMAVWYLRTEITPLLNGSRSDSGSRSLLEVASEFHHDAGWAAYDCGSQQLAIEYFAN